MWHSRPEFHVCNDGVTRWEREHNEKINQHRRSVKVVVDAAPTDNTEPLKYYKKQLERQESGSNDIIDVFQIDVVWVAELAEYL